MASALVSEDLSFDIPCDPVVLPCLPESRTTEEPPGCPVGRSPDAPGYGVFKNLCRSIWPERHHQASAESDKICIQHNKKLKFYCLTDEQLICLVCKTTRKHINHSVCSRDEATSRTKKQAKRTRRGIKKRFKKFRKFLHNEELERLSLLKKEEKQKRALIDVAKHLQNLSFEVLVNMQDIVQYTPVTLDPNTSHPSLLLSGDLTTITYQEEQLEKLPNNPERFQSRSMVLGSEGFISGTHCWDVEVGGNRAWAVGVITESAQRERASLSENQFWEVAFYTDMYEAQSLHEPLTALTLTTEPRRIRVELDYDNGILHFFDPVTKTALHTFKDTFTHRVFPYFQSDSCFHPLKIVPMKLSMRLKKHRLPAEVCASMNESLDESRSSEPLYENVELFKVKEAQ
ncbi:E3 ubiquitin-protein ligase TRIM39-like [Chanos chanos]|uniref:E3 ubiquitin-protein ligase TRIM39-like n=1 Tax=Chanos chanos TaxID=29144 RepID=A0A6J2WLK1_CHACN|nr:E3 ubiquitin-protein ligase TRIM39-like [Chanos chanos]